MPLKLAVLGATGPTGQLLVEQALDRGHEVVAVVRNPGRLGGHLSSRPGLTVTQVADLCSDPEGRLAGALAGCQAVVSALGAPVSLFRIDLLTRAVPTLAVAMRTAGVKRLVMVTAHCTQYHPDHSKLVEWLVKPLLIGRNMDDFWRAECYLMEQCGDLNFTVVKPPGLTNRPLDARDLKACEGQFVPEATQLSVPRANVAQFVLNCAESEEMWPGKLVSIGF